jgi:itaconate CoA-transferase
MIDAAQDYKNKTVSATEAAASIDDGSNLILGMGVAMPPAFMGALADRARARAGLNQLNVYYMHGNKAAEDTIMADDVLDVLKLHSLFMSPHDRALDARARGSGGTKIHYIPCLFHQVGRLLSEQIRPDCFVTTVSPMDRSGHFSLGTNADYAATLVRSASRVIVEVNREMPRTFGESLLHISQVDQVVEHDHPLMELPEVTPSAEDEAIADLIADQIPNRATIQMGVGGVPAAVMSRLSDHQDLGIHSELLSPPMVRLIQAGVITGAAKRVMPFKHVFTLALGDRAMYDFMDDNPSIVGYPAAWVNNPAVIRKNNAMISVNGAIQIDLSGQINSEHLNGRQFSGTGGQLDFVRGAYLSQGGKSIIALRSTAKGGSLSRIVPTLDQAAVTDTRMDAHFIATEFGIVDLKGLSLEGRAAALTSIAHPKFRGDLEAAWKTLR